MTYYDYRLFRTADTTAGTGLITTVGTSLVGLGTAFTTQLVPGSILFASTKRMVVLSIDDNENADLQVAVSGVANLSFTYNNLYNVELITPGMFPPKPHYRPWVEVRDLGDGTRRGLGRPLGAWEWGYLTQRQRDALRVYCPYPQVSVRTYLRTRQSENEDRYLTYEAVLLWPLEEKRVAFRLEKPSREQFLLEFRDMVVL